MKTIAEKFERIMMAVTFAEAGEHETARDMLRDDSKRDQNRPTIWKQPRKEYRAAPPRD